jgi:large conductance mechanosensitive channel
MLRDFRDFIMRGNVLDLAIAVIIGVAFGAVIKSLVDDVLMPPIGLLLGDVDFAELFLVLQRGPVPGPYETLQQAKDAGAVTWRYGLFINAIINLLIVAFALFVVIKMAKRMEKRKAEAPAAAPTTKTCPHCQSSINIKATRCAFCTSAV